MVSTNLNPFVSLRMVPKSLSVAFLVFCNWINASLFDFKDISCDLIEPFRALHFKSLRFLSAEIGSASPLRSMRSSVRSMGST